jgi:hypothetical protein
MFEFNHHDNLENILRKDLVYKEFISDWIPKRRWSGLKHSKINKIEVLDLAIHDIFNEKQKLILIYINCHISGKKDDQEKRFFIPFIINLKNDSHSLLKIKCNDGVFFLSYANYYLSYYTTIFRSFKDQLDKKMNNINTIKFDWVKEIGNPSEIVGFKILGEGDTTNSVVQLELKNKSFIIFKEYRIVKKRRENIFLDYLNSKGFPYAPELYGIMKLKNGNISHVIGILMQHIPSIGDGGILFWKNLIKNLEKTKNENIYDSEKISRDLNKNNIIKNISNTLMDIIVQFHKTMAEFDFNNVYLNNSDLNQQRKVIMNIIKKIKTDFKNLKKSQETITLHDIFRETFGEQSKIYDIIKYRDFLNNINIIHCHQDLHFKQMLSFKKDHNMKFYLIDFEGDPLLNYDLKMQKDAVFRDISSLIAALYYIRFNALREFYLKREQSDKKYIEVLIQISKNLVGENTRGDLNKIDFQKLVICSDSWLKFLVKNFLMRYFDQYTIKFKKDIKKSEYNNIISNGIKLYIIERAIRELSYELDHRPKNAFIPLLTIWENLNRDIINYSPI